MLDITHLTPSDRLALTETVGFMGGRLPTKYRRQRQSTAGNTFERAQEALKRRRGH
jgi:hypothetical protein